MSLIVKTIIDFANLFVDITINEENEDEGNVGEAFEGGGGGSRGIPSSRSGSLMNRQSTPFVRPNLSFLFQRARLLRRTSKV